MTDFSKLRLACAAALLLAASAAHAQYGWYDEKGLRQYSDQPPPPSVPNSKIFKSPAPAHAVTYEQPAAAAAPAPATAPKTPTLVDREADFKKRQKEQDELQAKQSAEAAQKKAACDQAMRAKSTYEMQTRMKEVDAKGEVSYLSDEDRAKRLAEANQAIAANGCR
jgi:hypothetical protein